MQTTTTSAIATKQDIAAVRCGRYHGGRTTLHRVRHGHLGCDGCGSFYSDRQVIAIANGSQDGIVRDGLIHV